MPSRAQFGFDGLPDLVQELFVGLALRFDLRDDLVVRVRLEVAKRQVLQLAADFSHPEPVRDGRIDFEGLLRDALLALALRYAERTHVVQAVRQLDDDDADVVDHRQQHLAEALGLAVFGRT